MSKAHTVPAAAQQRRSDEKPAPRPQMPLGRLLLLAIVTSALAFALQALLAVAGAPAAEAITLLGIPVVAAAVIFFGLRPYPAAGRLRMGGMGAGGLFLPGLVAPL